MNIGKLGVWSLTSFLTGAEVVAFAKKVEKWGYSALWVPEVTARDPIVSSTLILANTTKLIVATGVVSAYSRDPYAMTNSQYALAEQSNGRFLLGVGLSHGPFVEGVLGHKYESPTAKLRGYLEGMAKMKYMGAQPPEKPLTVIGAVGPKMLKVAGELADGAHPFNVTTAHTAEARKILGPGKLLCPAQMVLLETDPVKARELGRKALALSLTLPNYRNGYLRMGFSEKDLENGGSDKLVDGIVAWGDEKAIRARIQEHWDNGADHVCIQPLRREGVKLTPEDEKVLEVLAPG
jgi:probable F420-dependent oxidoreductase